MIAAAAKFRLIASVKRGSVPNLPEAWAVYETLDSARTGAERLLQHERVTRVMVIHNESPRSFVEWLA